MIYLVQFRNLKPKLNNMKQKFPKTIFKIKVIILYVSRASLFILFLYLLKTLGNITKNY